jgi:GT2 family glycosyltransferase
MTDDGISVVILNWNGKKFLRPCLESLRPQLGEKNEVIVVDNGSTDGSVEEIREEYPWVRLIPLEKNTGFAGGCNRGIEEAGRRWVFLLNNDTVVREDLLQTLASAIREFPRTEVLSCRMVGFSDPDRIDNLGLAPTFWTPGRQIRDNPERGREVFGPSGGAALIRKDLFESPGGFDEDFFAYCEDVDLAWRLRLRGATCQYIPAAVVRHVGSGTSGPGSPSINRLIQRNQEFAYFKNYPWLSLLATLPVHLLYNLLYLTRLTCRGQLGVWTRAKGEFLRNICDTWRKRRLNLKSRKVSRWRILLWSLGWGPR